MKLNMLTPLILILAPIILSACTNKTVSVPSDSNYVVLDEDPNTGDQTQSSQSAQVSENQYVAINTDYGQVIVELFSKIAPNTVKNFLDKVNSNYYDGLIFHRVVPDFVVQGGDPTGTGTGGGKINSELNQITFKTGSLGLARTPDTKEVSNDSQFFICLTDAQCGPLTGDYVNFGQVISGMDVVSQIKVNDVINSIVTTTK